MNTKCKRCLGLGQYAFNLLHGSVCTTCKGTGKIKNIEIADLVWNRRLVIAEAVRVKLDLELGPFENNENGSYARVDACKLKYGKTPGDFVQEQLINEGLVD